MGTQNCGTIWEHRAVGLYSRWNIELWDFTAVGTYSCVTTAVGTYSCVTLQLCEHRAAGLFWEHRTVGLYSCYPKFCGQSTPLNPSTTDHRTLTQPVHVRTGKVAMLLTHQTPHMQSAVFKEIAGMSTQQKN